EIDDVAAHDEGVKFLEHVISPDGAGPLFSGYRPILHGLSAGCSRLAVPAAPSAIPVQKAARLQQRNPGPAKPQAGKNTQSVRQLIQDIRVAAGHALDDFERAAERDQAQSPP